MHLPWRDVVPGDGPAISTSVTDAEAAALAKLAKGRRVLEIGSAFGFSAVTMALAGAKHVVAVDPHTWIPGSLAAMEYHLDAYGLADQVMIQQEPAASALSDLAAQGERFGLVFVDGDHSSHAVHADNAAALKILAKGGILAFHDYGEDCCCPGVREALDALYPDGPDELTGSLFVVKT